MSEERDLLLRAVERLRNPVCYNLTVTTTTTAGYAAPQTRLDPLLIGPQLRSVMAKMLQASADEWVDENGNDVAMCCGHCYDNVNIARIILGMNPVEDSDD